MKRPSSRWSLWALFFGVLLGALPVVAQRATGLNEGESVADAAVKGNPAMAPVKDVPGLPRVLLIGDSISIAYTQPVRDLLRGKANVHRAPVNCGSSNRGVAGTHGKKSWLGDGPWDVIHFNFGIWDAKLKERTGLPTTTTEDYIQNLNTVAARLQASGATVIFATTTPIPPVLLTEPKGEPLPPRTRLFIDVVDRNQRASESMTQRGITVNDLYSAIFPDREKFWKKDDLHFSPEGSALLAEVVASNIENALDRRARPMN